MDITITEVIEAMTSQYPPTNQVLLTNWLHEILEQERTESSRAHVLARKLIVNWLNCLNHCGLNNADLHFEAVDYLKSLKDHVTQ